MTIVRYSMRVLCAALLFSAAAMAQTSPETSEKIPGLKAGIEIIRDREGVPHIRAKSEVDAIFGLGFVHAQDRLWQLEYLRRLGRGRLAAVLGEAALPGDKLFRTLGVTQSAAATWTNYGRRQKELISAYVAGINSGAEYGKQKPPIEFVLLNIQLERWQPEDVLVVAKVLSWGVDQNWTQELLRVQLAQKLGPVRAAQLTPPFAKNGPIILPDAPSLCASRRPPAKRSSSPSIQDDVLSGLIEFDRRILEFTGLGGQGLGSNNQVVGPSRSIAGKPILASDPHLPSQLPSIFYRAHLTGGGLDVIGATAVGFPGMLMGHNGRVAWGWTNANADVQDLFLERVVDGVSTEYENGLEPLEFRKEIIKVKDRADVAITVRSSRHGPLVSDLVDQNGPALSLRWATLDPDDDAGVAAYLEANRARNWHEFTDAFRRFKAHPQNLMYADRDGNIGYLMPGTIPMRPASDGTAPVPGWTAQFEWRGYVPFDQLPIAFNPPQGYLASSNNRIASDRYPHTLGTSFAAPYRAARVLEMLGANQRHSVSDMERMQADVVAAHARELLPLLATVSGESSKEREALALLRQWDLKVTAASAPAAIFEAWYIELAESIFRDELGDALWRSYSDQLHMISMALAAAVRENNEWCDDINTLPKETCQAIALTALRRAITRMSTAQGSEDIASWQWGKVHKTVFFHQPFDTDPLLSRIFSRTTENGGDKHTVNVASNPRWTEYAQRHVALYRQIIDLSDLKNSRWIAAPGQSGRLLDPHYDDRIDEWRQGEYRPMLFDAKAIDEQAATRLVLLP